MSEIPKSDSRRREQSIELRPAVVALFYALALGAYLARVVAEPDYFFKLALGHHIVEHGVLPRANSWSVIGENLPWCLPGWLYAVALSLTETKFGEVGVAWFLLAVGWTFVWGLLSAFASVSRSYFFGGLLVTLVAVGTLESSSVSSFHLGLAALAGVLAVSSGEMQFGRRIAVLFALAAFAANFSEIGPAVAVAGVVVAWRHRVGLRLGIACALFGGLLCSPYLGGDVVQQLVGEWPARLMFELESRGSLASVFDYGFAIMLLLSLIAGLLLAARGAVLQGSEILLALATILLGLVYKPAMPFALVVVAYCAARIWRDAPDGALGELGASVMRMRSSLSRLPSVGTTWILLVLVIINVTKYVQEPVVPVLLPTQALDFVLDQNLPGPVLHEMAVGGYVAYRFSRVSPPRLSYIDPRAVFLDPKSAKQESALAKLGDGWRGLFERVPPETVVVRTKTALWELLKRTKGWKLAYQDSFPTEDGRVLEIPFGWAVFTRVPDVESAGEI